MLLIYLAIALGVSFLCSLLEAALLSLPPSHVATLAQNGSRSGRWLAWMKGHIDRPLAAILTLNTMAHTFGAAGVGAEATVVFGARWIGAVSVVVTILILLVSEIIPKTLGAVHARKLGAFTAVSVMVLIYATYPVVVVCEWLSRLVSGSRRAVSISRDEVLTMAQLGEAGGVLTGDEAKAIRNLLRLREVLAKDVMTPRRVVFALPADTPASEAFGRGQSLPFSRIPLYGESLDDLKGLVHRYRIAQAATQGRGDRPLSELARPLHAFPEQGSVASALEQFIKRNEQFFQVVDEYGGTAGILTLEDVLETMLGVEIVDETDTVTDMRELARRAVAHRHHVAEERIAAARE